MCLFSSLFRLFSLPFPKVDFFMHFGHPLARFGCPLGFIWAVLGTLWATFKSFLAPFGLHLSSFWHPLGSIWTLFGSVLASFWYPSGSMQFFAIFFRSLSFFRLWSTKYLSTEAQGPKTWVGGTPEGIIIFLISNFPDSYFPD